MRPNVFINKASATQFIFGFFNSHQALWLDWVPPTNFVLTRNVTGFKRSRTLTVNTETSTEQCPTIRVFFYVFLTSPVNPGTYISFCVFLTYPNNQDSYIFISRILLRSIIRVVISGYVFC